MVYIVYIYGIVNIVNHYYSNNCNRRGREGNLADAGNLADSNISETINDTKKNSINNL